MPCCWITAYNKTCEFCVTSFFFYLSSDGHMYPESWEPAAVPSLVRRWHNPQVRAAGRWAPLESPLCQAASTIQTQPRSTASGSPELSWAVWRRTTSSSSAPTADPPLSPSMMFLHWETHSNKRLWFYFTTGLDWCVVLVCDHILCADWILGKLNPWRWCWATNGYVDNMSFWCDIKIYVMSKMAP